MEFGPPTLCEYSPTSGSEFKSDEDVCFGYTMYPEEILKCHITEAQCVQQTTCRSPAGYALFQSRISSVAYRMGYNSRA